MNLSGAALLEQAGRYAHLLDGPAAGDRFEQESSEGPIRVAADHDLLASLAEATRLVRLAEAERVRIAGEIARRSEPRDDPSLARRSGTTGATDLVAQVAGVRREEAALLIRLGVATRRGEAMTGEVLPAARPHVAAALAAGRLDRVVAAALIRAVRAAEPGLTPGETLAFEAQLVERAQEGYPADDLIAFFRQAAEYAHPEGARGRDEQAAAAASVSKKTLDNGLTRWILDLDPITAGFFATALDANTARPGFVLTDPDEPAPTPEELDRRPLDKRRVDAVRLLSRKVLKVEDGQVAGTAVTLLVHIDHDALMTGIGTATISGVEGTISAFQARKLACEARIIPVVLDGDSQPIDLGTARRFFTEAQRLAMAARDQGCAGPCCDAPLSWTEAAHIKPAGYGPTSVQNGILLCRRCHRLLDEHGWQVTREGNRWWWTPPPWIDFTGRRRPGGPPPLHTAA